MSTATTTKMTAEEFFDFVHLPENANKLFELDRGEVIEMSSPAQPHCFVTANATGLLWVYSFAKRTCYVLSNDGGVILQRDPDIVRGPDVAVYNDARSRVEIHPKYGEVAPLLAVEVLSPSDRMGKVMQKVREYLQAGTRIVWVIDPEADSVQIFRPGELPAVAWAGDELSGYDVLPGFTCKVADLFAFPTPLEPPATESSAKT